MEIIELELVDDDDAFVNDEDEGEFEIPSSKIGEVLKAG